MKTSLRWRPRKTVGWNAKAPEIQASIGLSRELALRKPLRDGFQLHCSVGSNLYHDCLEKIRLISSRNQDPSSNAELEGRSPMLIANNCDNLSNQALNESERWESQFMELETL